MGDEDGNMFDEGASTEYTGKCPKLFPQHVSFDEVWSRLREVVENILDGKNVEKSKWSSAFPDVYSLCGALPKSLAIELYDKVDECITNHVKKVYQGIQNKHGKEFLEYFIAENKNIMKISGYLNSMFKHLNGYISHQSRELQIEEILSDISLKSDNVRYHIGQLVLLRWKSHVLVPCGPTISKLILEQFDNSREGKLIEQADILHQCVNAFIVAEGNETLPTDSYFSHGKTEDFKLYKEVFEVPLQDSCKQYYRKKGVEWEKLSDSVAFVESVASLIENEKRLARTLMNEATVAVVENWAAQTLVADKIKNLNLSFKSHMTLVTFNAKELRRCYNVLKLIEHGLVDLVKDFGEYITTSIKDALGKDANDPRVFVNAIAITTRKLQYLTEVTFDNHHEFTQVLNRAVRNIVNGDKNTKAGEKLARYADAMLRKSSSPDDERTPENVGLVLKFLDDKEQFERPYQMHLANRLLCRTSAGQLQEEAMIEMMREMCGSDFVHKFIRMLNDIVKSNEETQRYKMKVTKTTSSFPMEFTILQTGSWPLQIGSEVQGPFCPEEVAVIVQSFTSFYTENHTGRQLTWAPSLSSVDVKLTYLDKPYVITMTAIHYDIICCFERNDSLTVGKVCDLSRLTLDAAKRYLRAFFDNQVLLCDQKDDIQLESIIKLNTEFTRRGNRFRFNIPMTNKPVKQEIRPEVSNGQNNQRFTIECALVRIMKTKQKLKHQLLVAELINTVKDRFSPPTTLIKQCVESLIERAYFKRTEEIDEYEYIS